jgi:hypothetical protein
MDDPGSFRNRESRSSSSAPSLAALSSQVQENESLTGNSFHPNVLLIPLQDWHLHCAR